MDFYRLFCYNSESLEMYCIDGASTLTDCKPTLILESLNKDQTQYANASKRGVNLAEVGKEYLQNFASAFAPKALAVC